MEPSNSTALYAAEAPVGLLKGFSPVPHQLEVEVADEGPGIPEDVRPRLFEKFVTGRQRGSGSGLGLLFCRLAVEAHGGRIWVENGREGGAVFVFTLPAASPAQPR